MKNLKKYALVALAILICLSFAPNMAFASDSDTKDMGSKVITDTNKAWTIRFKSEIDISTFSNSVQINDLTTGSTFTPAVTEGNNTYSIKISAPSGGYVVGHSYQLVLNKGVKSKKGEVLPKKTVLSFSVKAKDNNSYSANAKVVTLTPYLPTLKQITINSSNLPSGTKYKVEGNNNLCNLGENVVSLIVGSNADVYFYSSDGITQIGTALLNVSSDSTTDIKITN
ncbi:hydrolase [Clostridiaceae bacterium UIB06]|uniref:Hydrolase n=1 Tax=Clostridium thailandense TaxID=2794346 RepID=A0A949WQ44_9CLOT|nr:hydrolase [Clostridium thailandense]MBV7272225.1 hydrolase [Clostridium thailandense]MCH5136490.1 hydrolase [Clostridiaceae bacterium UIB06]